MKSNPRTTLLAFAALALVITGCRLGQPGTASFASVVVHQHTVAEIQLATAQVFRENGYAGFLEGPSQMVFERPGTRGETLSRQGVVGTHYGAQTVVRMRVNLVDLGGGSYRMEGQTFMVRDAGDSFFEDEVRLANFRAGPYQKLLDQAAERLKPAEEKK